MVAERTDRTRHRLLHRTKQFGRLVLQQVGVVSVDGEDRVPRMHVFGQRTGEPGRALLERVARGVGEARQLQRLVTPERLDERRTGLVGTLGDAADERRRFERTTAVGERPDDEQTLARLKVERDADSKVAVACEGVVEVVPHIVGSSQDT